MAIQSPTPGTAGVNAAHGANSPIESNQDNTGPISFARAKALYEVALERTRIAGRAHNALEVAVIAAQDDEAKALVREQMNADAIEHEWDVSTTEDMRAWEVLAASKVQTRAEMIAKIRICRSPEHIEASYLEAGEVIGLLDALVRDLEQPAQDDADIIATFEGWRKDKQAYRDTQDGDPSEWDKDGYTPEQSRLWGQINDAEKFIRDATPKTIGGVIAQLHIALMSINLTSELEDDLVSGDLAKAYAERDDLEWTDGIVISAIHALQAMEA